MFRPAHDSRGTAARRPAVCAIRRRPALRDPGHATSTRPEFGSLNAGEQRDQCRFAAARRRLPAPAGRPSRSGDSRRAARDQCDRCSGRQDRVRRLRARAGSAAEISSDPGNSCRVAAWNKTAVRCHATAAPANCHAPAVSRLQARYASSVPPTAIAIRAVEAVPVHERRRQTEQADHQPAARNQSDQPPCGSVQPARALQVFFERFVLAVMPAIGRELRQARAVTSHALDQIVRHRQTHVGPVADCAENSSRRSQAANE